MLRGPQCKFSHDKDVGRKVEKRNLYVDDREGGPSVDKSKDTMETWDEEKLRSVVLSKAGNPKTTTDVRPYSLAAARLSSSLTLATYPDRLQVLHPGC